LKNKMKKLLGVLAIFILILIVLPLSSAHEDDLTFIAFGHVYPDYEALELSISLVNSENPDFVIFLGDSLVSPSNSWPDLKEIIEKIEAPVYFVPGNHDIYENGTEGGYFLEEMSKYLFQDFTIKNRIFIILNSVTDQNGVYDISEQQADYVKFIYRHDQRDKFIFVHHCLFYNYDNMFCNSREYFEGNNWNNEIVPLLQKETIAVFVGDTGVNEPYFGYSENNVSYFGVGFSPEESQLKIPQHFLKVVVDHEKVEVIPIPIRQDLSQVKYEQRLDKKFIPLLKTYIKKNLKIVLQTLLSIILILLILVIYLLIKPKKK